MTTSWGRIALIYGIGVLAAGQLGIVPPLVAVLQRDLGLSLAGAGLAVSMVTLVGALLGLPAGGLCERLGHARALRAGTLVMAVAAGLCAMAEDATLLLAARALAGIGYLLVVVAAPSLMAAIAEPRHHAFALSLWSTFVPTGIALAGLLAASFADPAGWRLAFAADAVVLALGAVVAFHAGPHDHGRAPAPDSQRLPIELLRGALPLSVAFFCFALLFLALAGLLPAYLTEARGLESADAGRIVATTTALAIPGSLAAGWLMRRGARPGRLAAAGLIASTVIATSCFSGAMPITLAIASIAISFALGGLVPAAAFASVPRIAIDRRAIGPINGLLAQAGSLGSLAGPPALAAWVEWTGWALAPVMLLAIAAVGAVCALAVTRR